MRPRNGHRVNLFHILLEKLQPISIKQCLDGAAAILQGVTILPFTKVEDGLQLSDNALPGGRR